MMIYVNQSSKKTRKQKAKQKKAWEQQLAKYGTTKTKSVFVPLQAKPSVAVRPGANDYKNCKSVDTGVFNAFKGEQKKYTGTAIVGIATMHKSNIVPIFSNDQAVEVAKMRRG